MISKGDIVSEAYSRMRISGLTVDPSPEDVMTGLSMLEQMAAEWYELNIDANYNFSDYGEADPNEDSGIPMWALSAFSSNLALRLLSDFGKTATQELYGMASQSYSFISNKTAPVRELTYSQRMPVGTGNRIRSRYQRFYGAVTKAPLDADTIKVKVGSIQDYEIDIDALLGDDETLTSYTKEVGTGLTLLSDTYANDILTLRVRADEAVDASIKVTITASTGNVYPVCVWYSIRSDC